MAQLIQYDIHSDKIIKARKSSRCFVGCVGFSRWKPVAEKRQSDDDDDDEEHMMGSRKKAGWFSNWRPTVCFRIKKKSHRIKTARPVDGVASEKASHRSNQIHSAQHIPANQAKGTPMKPAILPIHTAYDEYDNPPIKSILLKVDESLDDVDSRENDKCGKRLSFVRKIEDRKTGNGLPGSPVQQKKQSADVGRNISGGGGGRSGELNRKNETLGRNNKNNIDPVVGMSVVMVSLVIMLVWGRLCAILCTSALLYFVPRFRADTDTDTSTSTGGGGGGGGGSNVVVVVEAGQNHSDSINYKEYYNKKKVVLEGFLDRKHRN